MCLYWVTPLFRAIPKENFRGTYSMHYIYDQTENIKFTKYGKKKQCGWALPCYNNIVAIDWKTLKMSFIIVFSNINRIQNFHWINIFVARGPKAKKEKSSETKSSNMLSLSSWVFSYQCLDPLPHRQGICPKKTSLCLFSNSNISN